MLSNDMKNKLILGKYCMEKSELILSLCSSYSLLTTDLAANDSLCVYPTFVETITLSEEEMLQLLSAFVEDKYFQKIGLPESSLLFIAKRYNIKIAVADMATQCICDELGIETITVQSNKSEVSGTIRPAAKSNTSRLSFFKVAACI